MTICGSEGMTLCGSATKESGAGAVLQEQGEQQHLLLPTAPAPESPLLLVLWLITVAGAGGEFARVFGAAAGALVRGTTARCGVWTTALVAHLGR